MQLRNNIESGQQWEYDTFVKVFSDIQAETNDLRYTFYDSGLRGEGTVSYMAHDGIMNSYGGSEAISKFIQRIRIHLQEPSIGIMSDISFILEDLSALIDDINNSSIATARRDFLLHRINRFYITKFQTQLISIASVLKEEKNEVEKSDQVYNHAYYVSVLKGIEMKIERMRNSLSLKRRN